MENLKNKIEKIKNSCSYEDVELFPVYDTRKSFYNKAIIRKYYGKNNTIKMYQLFSYNTLVLTLIDSKYSLNYEIEENLLFSNTTLRHIKDFLKQKYYLHNKIINNKKDVILYNEK